MLKNLTVESIKKMGDFGMMEAVQDPKLLEQFSEVLAQAGLSQKGEHGSVKEVRGQRVKPVIVWTFDQAGAEKEVQTYFFPV